MVCIMCYNEFDNKSFKSHFKLDSKKKVVDGIHHITYSKLKYDYVIDDRRDIPKRHNNFKDCFY